MIVGVCVPVILGVLLSILYRLERIETLLRNQRKVE